MPVKKRISTMTVVSTILKVDSCFAIHAALEAPSNKVVAAGTLLQARGPVPTQP